MGDIIKLIENSVNGGFWQFLGYWIMIFMFLVIPAKLIIILVNRSLRHWNIRKYGYPPSHCDADGDFKNESEQT
jgi:Na+/serine symporter